MKEMTNAEATTIIFKEIACVKNKSCERSECRDCELVMSEEDILTALLMAKNALRNQERAQMLLDCEKNKTMTDFRRGRVSALYDALGMDYSDREGWR